MGNIKGITVEIGGDTTGLNKALESVNKTIKSTASELKDIDRLLKLDPTNTELLSQKQETLKEKISATKEKLDTLKTAQEQAKAQLERGDLGKDTYDALEREIIKTEEELKKLAKEAANANTTLCKKTATPSSWLWKQPVMPGSLRTRWRKKALWSRWSTPINSR